VLKGERLRILLELPSNEILEETKQVFLLKRDAKVFPGKTRVKISKDAKDKLPDSAVWEIKLLDEFFTFLRVSQDAAKKHVIWLVQAKRSVHYLPNEVPFEVRFYDGEEARVYEARLGFRPASGVLKGERVRIVLALPDNETLKETKRVILLKKDQKEFPAAGRVKIKGDLDTLPGKAAWDVKRLLELFTLLKVKLDAEKKHVIWLAQAKRGIHYVPNEVVHDVQFVDGKGTTVYSTRLRFEPASALLKGERLRIWLPLPSDEILKQTTKVILKKP
jgi:hypothetical protein